LKTRKELKSEYKQIKQNAGVFIIKNIINGKIFIGSSENLNTVWNSQKFKLDSGFHPNLNLLNDWNTGSLDNFVFEIVEIIKNPDEIIDIKYHLKELLKITKDKIISSGNILY
jgi:hypothetical protein